MDQKDQIDFGVLQRQERFKKLERSLRVTRLKHSTNAKLQSIPWPSCSSINVDHSDFNCTSSTLQYSRSGSEVLTSCLHLQNLISNRPYYPMATSSVKKYSETDQSADDRAIMPPPSNCNMIQPHLKRPAPVDPTHERIKSQRQFVHNSGQFSQEKQTYQELNSSNDPSDDLGCPPDFQKGKLMNRHFYRWKVFLNDQGELLIKGSLNNEIWARSKPVVKMISSTKVESKYQHTYHLHGNIIDEKNELPKYVYSKFYNGFPDDWKNVHQIWKNYVTQGSKESFRWPTDVSFSDDDLNSEITDFTQLQKTEKKFQEFSFMDKSTPQRSSGYSSDIQQDRDSKYIENSSKDQKWKNQSMRNNSTENVVQLGEKENRSQHENKNQFDVSNDRSCSGNLYTALNYAHTLKDIIFEDKLTTITQNLLHEKCPKEYVRNVNRTIEYLNYLLSYKIGELDESASKKPRIELMSNSPTQDLRRKCSTPLLYEPNLNVEVVTEVYNNEIIENKLDSNMDKRAEKCERSPVMKKTHVTYLKADSEDSENEIYGVPKISEKILQTRVYHKRQKKFVRNGKIGRAELNSNERKSNLANDSTVSIMEEETHNNYKDDEENVGRSDSRNRKNKINVSGSKIDYFIEEGTPDPLRENRVPLEMLRAADFEENRNPSKIPVSNKVPSSTSNEKRKLMKGKENMEVNNEDEFSELFQRKETQNLQNSDSNNRGNQKPRIVNLEKVNLIHNFKRPSVNQILSNEPINRQDQREKEEKSSLATSSRITEVLKNPEETVSENIQENLNNDSFGSEKNPKLLENWIPLVVFNGKKYHLVFEGTLLNAVGRLMQRKFTTNQVIRRISSTIVETADHQFYKLFGDLNNNKHIVPKELLSQCRNGCPVKIDHFCVAWLKLKGESNMVELSQKTTTDQKHVPLSSRGRIIIPPLNFWADERIVKKDGDVVYKSGDPKENFVTSVIGSPLRKSPDHVTTNETMKGVWNSEDGRRVIKNKVAHKLNFESSESEEEKNTLSKQKSQNVDLKEAPSKNDKELRQQNQNPRRPQLYGLRKRQRIESDVENYPDKIQKETAVTKQMPKLRNAAPKIHCIYNKKVRDTDVTLSDDQMSVA